MSSVEEQAVMTFIKAFVPANKEEEHQKWFDDYMEEEHPKEERFLLFGPSRIVGLARADGFDIQWKRYSVNKSPDTKHFGLVFFEKGFYSTRYIEEILQLYENEVILEIKELTGKDDIHALAFRFFEEYIIIMAERITNDYIVKDDGVIFIQTEWNEETETNEEIGRTFVEWEKDVATNIIYKGSYEFITQVYKKPYIFQEYEEQGDFLAI